MWRCAASWRRSPRWCVRRAPTTSPATPSPSATSSRRCGTWLDAHPDENQLLHHHLPGVTSQARVLQQEFEAIHVQRAFAYLATDRRPAQPALGDRRPRHGVVGRPHLEQPRDPGAPAALGGGSDRPSPAPRRARRTRRGGRTDRLGLVRARWLAAVAAVGVLSGCAASEASSPAAVAPATTAPRANRTSHGSSHLSQGSADLSQRSVTHGGVSAIGPPRPGAAATSGPMVAPAQEDVGRDHHRDRCDAPRRPPVRSTGMPVGLARARVRMLDRHDGRAGRDRGVGWRRLVVGRQGLRLVLRRAGSSSARSTARPERAVVLVGAARRRSSTSSSVSASSSGVSSAVVGDRRVVGEVVVGERAADARSPISSWSSIGSSS